MLMRLLGCSNPQSRGGHTTDVNLSLPLLLPVTTWLAVGSSPRSMLRAPTRTPAPTRATQVHVLRPAGP
eukprot:1274709-Pyramimonas_sp.AAC.1